MGAKYGFIAKLSACGNHWQAFSCRCTGCSTDCKYQRAPHLDGRWPVIVDPYDAGSLDYRAKPLTDRNAFFKNYNHFDISCREISSADRVSRCGANWAQNCVTVPPLQPEKEPRPRENNRIRQKRKREGEPWPESTEKAATQN